MFLLSKFALFLMRPVTTTVFEELCLGVVEPVESIVKIIQGTKPRALTLARAFTASNWNIIGQALKGNAELQKLTIRVVDVQSLLHHLESHHALETLILGQVGWRGLDDDAFAALAAFVAATTSLRQLQLHRFHVRGTIEPLVEALKVNQSINDFALCDSIICQQASRELSEFFQSEDATTNGIKHLKVHGCSLRGGTVNTGIGELLTSLLGPSLDSLAFSHWSLSLLVEYLSGSGVVNRMPPNWHAMGLDFAKSNVLATLLPQAANLTELDLSFTHRQGGRHSPMNQLLPALRQNWSLTSVSLTLDNGEPYCKKDTDDLKMIETYCTRNAEAPDLLCGPAPSQDEESTVRRLVTPSLFALMAVQASESSIHSVLPLVFKGVFAMDAEAGSRHGGATKRARSDAASATGPVGDELNPRLDTNEPKKKRAVTMDAQGKPLAQPTE